MIKGISFGRIEPGSHVSKTIHMSNTGGEGNRTVDISIQSRVADTSDTAETTSPTSPGDTSDTTETLRTLTVPVVAPLKLVHDVTYQRSLSATPGLLDLRTFEGDFWDNTDGGEAVVASTMHCVGPWSVEVENISLGRRVSGSFSVQTNR